MPYYPTETTLDQKSTNYGHEPNMAYCLFLETVFLDHSHEYLYTFSCCLFGYKLSSPNFRAEEDHKDNPGLCHHFIDEKTEI